MLSGSGDTEVSRKGDSTQQVEGCSRGLGRKQAVTKHGHEGSSGDDGCTAL